jgi:hypothetical protein
MFVSAELLSNEEPPISLAIRPVVLYPTPNPRPQTMLSPGRGCCVTEGATNGQHTSRDRRSVLSKVTHLRLLQTAMETAPHPRRHHLPRQPTRAEEPRTSTTPDGKPTAAKLPGSPPASPDPHSHAFGRLNRAGLPLAAAGRPWARLASFRPAGCVPTVPWLAPLPSAEMAAPFAPGTVSGGVGWAVSFDGAGVGFGWVRGWRGETRLDGIADRYYPLACRSGPQIRATREVPSYRALGDSSHD